MIVFLLIYEYVCVEALYVNLRLIKYNAWAQIPFLSTYSQAQLFLSELIS